MYKKIISTLLLSSLLTSCITISVQTNTPVSPHFVTATLPPTKEATPRATRTPTPATVASKTSSTSVGETKTSSCRDAAVLLEDVTIPDNSKVPAGKIFTKTWKFKNTGTCSWTNYTINYVTGDRMSAPDSAPVPETEAGATVDISIELTAPISDGSYTTYFSLHNANGESISIGVEKTFWVKVIVGSGATPVGTGSSSTSSDTSKVSSNTNCQYSENAGYVSQLLNLINAARSDVKLKTVALNSQLTSAAQKHSADMACNNFLDHTGSDGSWILDRIINAGYPSNAYFSEIIAIGTPQNAMDQWSASAIHWESVINTKITEVGIGYAYNAESDYGGYFTVDMGMQ